MRLLRRYGLWILLCTAVCIVAAWIAGAARPVQYTSTASVDVEAAPVPGVAPATVNLVTEKQVATGGVVRADAARQLGTTPAELSGHIGTTVPSGANVLSISCTMADPVAARNCAGAVSGAYMRFRNDAAQPPRVRARDPLTVTLVTPAPLPTKPSGLSFKILLALGVLGGVLLGIGTAVIRDRLDDRVRDRDDLADCLDAPVLASVPRIHGASAATAAATAAPDSAVAESFRFLRAHVEPQIADNGSGTVVLVTGAVRQEGRSCVASGLAAALARSGRRVLLVDADFRNPTLTGGNGARSGLTDVLAGHAAVSAAAASTRVPGLRLMTAGRQAGMAGDLMHQGTLEQAIADMRATADVIVIDSGPALAVSEPVALAPHADLVLQVASVQRSQRDAVRIAARELRLAGAHTLLGVLTGVPRATAGTRPVPVLAPAPEPSPAAAGAGPARSDKEPAATDSKPAVAGKEPAAEGKEPAVPGTSLVRSGGNGSGPANEQEPLHGDAGKVALTGGSGNKGGR